jgi:hypothetical protein
MVGGSTGSMRAGETYDMTGNVPVIVVGRAFGLDHNTLEQTIAGDMQNAAWSSAHFIPSSQATPESADARNYSVVFLLNPPTGADPGVYCTGRVPVPGQSPPMATGHDIALSGALCKDGKNLRQVRTGANNVAGTHDPAFRKMVQQATTELTMSAGEPGIYHGSDEDR